MSSLDPADLAELGRDRGATLIGQGRQGPPGDPRLLLNDIEEGQAVTKDADGNPAGISVVSGAELAAAIDVGAGIGKLARGDSPELERKVIKSRTLIRRGASATFYTYPPRVMGSDPGHRKVIARNLGTRPFQVGYGDLDNGNFVSPAGAAFTANGTVQPGQEWVGGADPRTLFLRPVVSGDPLIAEVYTEIGVR